MTSKLHEHHACKHAMGHPCNSLSCHPMQEPTRHVSGPSVHSSHALCQARLYSRVPTLPYHRELSSHHHRLSPVQTRGNASVRRISAISTFQIHRAANSQPCSRNVTQAAIPPVSTYTHCHPRPTLQQPCDPHCLPASAIRTLLSCMSLWHGSGKALSRFVLP